MHQTQQYSDSQLSRPAKLLALLQAAYYLFTGIWPLVGIDSFQKVSGPKTDLWLVKTVGVLVAVIGAVVGLAALQGRITQRERLLATASAAGLAAVDVIYALQGRIWPVYLLDAILQLIFIGGWTADAVASAESWPENGDAAAAARSGHRLGQSYWVSSFEPGAG